MKDTIDTNQMHKKIIDLMLQENVLSFGDFVLKSGRKAPYFMNFGKIKNGLALSTLGALYAEVYENKIKEPTVLFGPAYKGIPLSVALATSLYTRSGISLPVCYNRKEKKDHGEGGVIVGHKLSKGDKVTIIEDVITAGTAVRESIGLIHATGAKVESLIVAVDRMEKGQGSLSTTEELADEFGINVYSIITIKEIVENVDVSEEMLLSIKEYLKTFGSSSSF